MPLPQRIIFWIRNSDVASCFFHRTMETLWGKVQGGSRPSPTMGIEKTGVTIVPFRGRYVAGDRKGRPYAKIE